MAFVQPSSFIQIPSGLLLPLSALGLLFLACGLWVRSRSEGRAAAVFFVYALGGAIHWGGAIGSTDPPLELAWLFVYVAFSALSEGAFLHLAWIYPLGARLGRLVAGLIYLPAALAVVAAPLSPFLSRSLAQALLGGVLLVANLLAVGAALVFVVRLFRVDGETRRDSRLPLIVAAVLTGGILSLLGSSLPGPADAWNLATGLIPLSLALALGKRRPDSEISASE